MKMPTNVAVWLQFKLYLITIDQFSPDSFLVSADKLYDDSKSRWQFTVDMIYRCSVCGLMDLWNSEYWQDKGISGVEFLAKTLAKHNPENWNNELVLAHWVAPEIIGTELCKSLSDKYDLDSYSYTPGVVCESFIEEIEVIFERNGMEWSELPLLQLG